jgi:hypothetical protein
LPLAPIGVSPTPVKGSISIGMVTAFALWMVVVIGGTVQMIHYSNTPSVSGLAPGSWPVGSQIPFDAHRPTLVMFAHPRCPCTRASLGELEELLAKFPARLSTWVVFLKPTGTDTNWEKTDLWRKASSISGVRVFTDNAGNEAHRFQSETSGQTLLYDRSGQLLFQGGITLSRGHAGDNPGRSALQELLLAGHSNQAKTPVFGCSLFEAQCKQGDIICKPQTRK